MSSSDGHLQENALLQLCARPHVTAEVANTASQLLSAEIDWTYLIRAGYQHQLIPLVDRTLQQVGEPQVPGDILYSLSYRVKKNHQRNRYLANQWFALSQRFASAGMQTPIPIQGPPLTARVYGDLSLRQAGVLAFFVRDGDLALAHESLFSQGFHKQKQNEEVEYSAVRPLASSSCYQRIRDRVILEMHSVRSLDDSPSGVPNETLWNRATTWQYQEREVLVLTPNDHLIALCLQGAREQWRMLGTLADIAHFVHGHSEFDVGVILARSRTLGCEPVSALGLMLAGWLVEMKQSALLLSAEGAKRIEQNANEIWTQLFQEGLANERLKTPATAGSNCPMGGDGATNRIMLETAKTEAQKHWAKRSDAWQRWSDLTLVAMTDFSEKLFDAAGVAAGHRVLDLACGPGDTSLLLSPRVDPSGVVVGTDLVTDMVKAAAQRARAAKLANIIWSVADMENLPFADGVFDAVVCRLGIMYCPRVERALCEARRVLKPGGRAAFLVCGPMENNHLLAVVHEVLWDLFDVRPDTVPAPFRFAPKNSLTPLLEEAGFTSGEEKELRSDKTLPRRLGLWQPSTEQALGWKLDALPPLTRGELQRRMDAALQPYLAGDSYRFSSHYRIGVGTNPS